MESREPALVDHRRIAPFAVLGISMLLTVIATAAVSVVVEQRETARFEARVRAAEERFRFRLDTYVAMLRSGRALLQATEGADGPTFERWVDALDLEVHHPAVRALG